MESFFKNFEFIHALFRPSKKSGKRFVFRRRSAKQLMGGGIFFLVVAGILFQTSLNGHQFLAISLTLIAAVLAVFAVDVDSLELDDKGNVIVNVGWPGFKSRQLIAKSSIEFIGVGIGEKYPDSGKLHLVYIRHNGQITALQHFVFGREAVVLAKQIKQFIGV